MIDGKRVVAVIPGRAGSQGLPRKNVRPLAGKPLIDWTFQAAAGSALIDERLLSTNDPEVADIGRLHGVAVIDRPAHLAGPDASVIDAIEHALAQVASCDYVVLLQPTSPLRAAADIDDAVRFCHETGAPAVFSVSPLPKPGAFYGRLVNDRFAGWAAIGEPVVLNGAVYVGRPDRLFRERTFQPDEARPWVMSVSRGIDVDTLFDLAVCEALAPLMREGRELELDVLRR